MALQLQGEWPETDTGPVVSGFPNLRGGETADVRGAPAGRAPGGRFSGMPQRGNGGPGPVGPRRDGGRFSGGQVCSPGPRGAPTGAGVVTVGGVHKRWETD